MNETDLIHMNGRTYDYNLGRFLSVDPVIQAPQNSQSLNPYSYIMNNPLSGTDPTGYTSFGLNGGKCNGFSSGSCTFAFFGDGTDERQNRRNVFKLETTNSNGSTSSVTFASNDEGGIDIFDASMNGVSISDLGGPGTQGSSGRVDPALSLACAGLACQSSLLSSRQIIARATALSLGDFALPVGEVLAVLFIADQVFRHIQVNNAIDDLLESDAGIVISANGNDDPSNVRTPSTPETSGNSGAQPPDPDDDEVSSLSQAAAVSDRNGLTKAGRALQKHSSRPGSAFNTDARAATNLNTEGQRIVDRILRSPNARVLITDLVGEMCEQGYLGEVSAYNADGSFRGFLEPPGGG